MRKRCVAGDHGFDVKADTFQGDLVIILKALGKEQIDEVISVSKEMNRGASESDLVRCNGEPSTC